MLHVGDIFKREWHGLRQGAHDPFLGGALALGFVAWAIPQPHYDASLPALAIKALAEEFFFRGGVQGVLRTRLHRQWRAISLANIISSLLFCLAHLISHSPGWALAVFFPSVVFGILWDRNESIFLCAGVHFWYNALLVCRPY